MRVSIIRVLISASPPLPPTKVTQRMCRHFSPPKKAGGQTRGIGRTQSAAVRNTRPSHNDANSGARPLRGNSLTNDHQDPSTSPPRRPPIHRGKGPRPERNHWDSSYVGELREYYGPAQMHTLAPTRTIIDTEAHINPREHGPSRGKIPST